MEQRRIRKISSNLKDNISSDYFTAAAMMHRTGVTVVYVEGYEDIAFWRSIFDQFETSTRRFEIATPVRDDMAKGKKVVLNFAPQAGKSLLLCVDSDFDYLMGEYNEQSRTVNNCPFVIQTYVYAIENLMCFSPSLHSVAAKATKNDTRIFDFEHFFHEYSEIIFPVFLWYYYAAKTDNPSVFTLNEFRNTVKINFLEIDNDGEQTLAWLTKQVEKRIQFLNNKFPQYVSGVKETELEVLQKGVKREATNMFIQGHTLMDYVVKPILVTVCDNLRKMWVSRIYNSSREGLPLANELSYYNNSLRDVDSLLLDNTSYQDCVEYRKILDRIGGILREN